MKYTIFLLLCLVLSGCSVHHDISLKNDASSASSTAQGNLIEPIGSGVSPTLAADNLWMTGNTLVYSGVFRIHIPTDLPLHTHDIDMKARYIEQFHLTKDSENKNRKSGYFHFTISPAVDRRKELSDEDKCIFGNYDEDVVSKKTIHRQNNNKDIYITYITFSAMGNVRKQGDLCFVDNNLIYTISLGGYSQSYIESIINSLTFN